MGKAFKFLKEKSSNVIYMHLSKSILHNLTECVRESSVNCVSL